MKLCHVSKCLATLEELRTERPVRIKGGPVLRLPELENDIKWRHHKHNCGITASSRTLVIYHEVEEIISKKIIHYDTNINLEKTNTEKVHYK